MALLPDLARLRVAPNGPKVWPILQCENVFILPGVPQFFEKKIDTIVAHFLGKRSLFTRKIVLGVDGAWCRRGMAGWAESLPHAL